MELNYVISTLHSLSNYMIIRNTQSMDQVIALLQQTSTQLFFRIKVLRQIFYHAYDTFVKYYTHIFYYYFIFVKCLLLFCLFSIDFSRHHPGQHGSYKKFVDFLSAISFGDLIALNKRLSRECFRQILI